MCSSPAHDPRGLSTNRRLKYATVLNCIFVLLEFTAGIFSGSLALLTDAIHNAVDSITLGIAYGAGRLATRPADKDRTYGYHRVIVLAALANALVLVLVLFGIGYFAIQRFSQPVQIDGALVILTGIVGVVCNLAVAWILHASKRELHVQGAYLHNLTDAASSAAVAISGLVIYLTGAQWVDLVLSLGICVMLGKSIVPIFQRTVHILLEGTPDGVDAEKVKAAILRSPQVEDVHDLHCWMQGDGMAAMTCHVVVRADVPHGEDHDLVDNLRGMLRSEFGLTHTTIQVEHENCEQAPKCLWGETKPED